MDSFANTLNLRKLFIQRSRRVFAFLASFFITWGIFSYNEDEIFARTIFGFALVVLARSSNKAKNLIQFWYAVLASFIVSGLYPEMTLKMTSGLMLVFFLITLLSSNDKLKNFKIITIALAFACFLIEIKLH